MSIFSIQSPPIWTQELSFIPYCNTILWNVPDAFGYISLFFAQIAGIHKSFPFQECLFLLCIGEYQKDAGVCRQEAAVCTGMGAGFAPFLKNARESHENSAAENSADPFAAGILPDVLWDSSAAFYNSPAESFCGGNRRLQAAAVQNEPYPLTRKARLPALQGAP
ncbi:MAG: hypothetical protein ACI3VX_01420 [Faecousia sp.]